MTSARKAARATRQAGHADQGRRPRQRAGHLPCGRAGHLKEAEAAALIEHQITTITEHRQAVCEEAELPPVDRKLFAGRQFVNGHALEGLGGYKGLQHAFRAARDALIASGTPEDDSAQAAQETRMDGAFLRSLSYAS